MSETSTPICTFGADAHKFNLKCTNEQIWTLDKLKGERGLLIFFICNHCPYVKAIIEDLVDDCKQLFKEGINSVAVMSNDTVNYPDDSFKNMVKFAKIHKFEKIEYLIDQTQDVARKYGAVCTPDFFGYNRNLELQYRGRIRELKDLKPIRNGKSDLRIAMKMISQLQEGPKEQIPSMGCSIKWFK